MPPLFVYECSNRHETEALRARDVLSIPCPQCSLVAERQAVYAVAGQMAAGRDWTSPVRDNGRIRTPLNERPISLRQYREATEQLDYEHKQAEESAQKQLPNSPLWRMAKQRAQKLLRGGIKDSLDYDPRYAPKD